jgi:hypothetical protein
MLKCLVDGQAGKERLLENQIAPLVSINRCGDLGIGNAGWWRCVLLLDWRIWERWRI